LSSTLAGLIANPENTDVITVPVDTSTRLDSENFFIEGLQLDSAHMEQVANISCGLP
jgi:hypothetical protein